jgi:hypothetical protein
LDRADSDRTATATDPNTLAFLTMTSRPRIRVELKAGDGGETAVYMTNWVKSRGETGP